jgi:hypothetical protein
MAEDESGTNPVVIPPGISQNDAMSEIMIITAGELLQIRMPRSLGSLRKNRHACSAAVSRDCLTQGLRDCCVLDYTPVLHPRHDGVERLGMVSQESVAKAHEEPSRAEEDHKVWQSLRVNIQLTGKPLPQGCDSRTEEPQHHLRHCTECKTDHD